MTEAPAPSGPHGVALIILDGWGEAAPGEGNAISLASTPVYDHLREQYPWALLEASGEAVGLPAGVMGNSEVGHLTLGSGRVIYQDLTRINAAIEGGSFYENPVLRSAMRNAQETGASVHLMGLVSDGGVHAALEHIHALVKMAHGMDVQRLYVHAFMDGRDTSPTAGRGFLRDLAEFLAEEGLGKVATVAGRYYAMDRDKRWQRTRKAYQALVGSGGEYGEGPVRTVEAFYESGVTDEFIDPTVVDRDPHSRVREGDSVIFFNFRPDRARQLTRALTEEGFAEFERGTDPPAVQFVAMTEYDATSDVPVAFPDEEPVMVLAEVLANAGLSQLHIAETEKYAHVTFFFNGGREDAFPREIRRLIPSPTEVPTYDQKPEMSARGVAAGLKEVVEAETPDFVILNFANPDMVGHTGIIPATIAGLETVDECLGGILEVLGERGFHILVTSDHGNAESMMDEEGAVNTAHTTNPVPFIYAHPGVELREGADLSDVAPTVLALLGLAQPAEMTGRPLL